MAFKAGKDSYVALDSVAGSVTNVSPYADNFDWPQSVDQQEVSAFGTTSKAFVTGLTDGDQIPIAGPYDVTLYTQLTGLKAAQAAGSSTATVIWGPGGSVSGQAKITAETWVKSVGVKSGVGGRVDIAATLQVTGAVTNGTW